MIEYSEYKSLVDVLEKSDVTNTYEELMKKEENVLNTVNHVVKHIQDTSTKNKQFIHMSLYEIVMLFLLEMPLLLEDLIRIRNIDDIYTIFAKQHRVILLGMMCICAGLFLFFLEISK